MAGRAAFVHVDSFGSRPNNLCGYLYLGGFCRTHHVLKHLPGWHVTQAGTPGAFTWTTPSGRRYTTAPDIHPI